MYQSLGQACDLFESNEYDLFENIKNKKFEPIEVETFSKFIDLEMFIEDEGWLPEEINLQDPDVVFYRGKIGDKELLGINHSGIDQIFTENGVSINKEDFQLLKITKKLENDSLSWALLPENSVESIKRTGKEYNSREENDFIVIEGQKGIRYQIIEKDEPVAAIFVVDNTIDTIYTAFNKRQQSLSKRLIQRALEDFPDLKHSDVQTDLGKKYSKNSQLKMR